MTASGQIQVRPESRVRLIFTSDQSPGYRRIRRGRGFRYLDPDGNPLQDKREIRRITSLAVPPAYEDVWICPNPNGHLQATGIDARGRKQYRYHPDWHASAADRKFTGLAAFAKAIPGIRSRIRSALVSEGLTRDRVIAGVVALLDATGYRIGNERYARENRTYGLTSLLSRHLKEVDGKLTLRFTGKAGLPHEADVSSPVLVRLIDDLHELPGQHLFRYESDDGSLHDLCTTEVNDWLKEVGGGEFTAKQFRTWRATVLCARALGADPPPETNAAKEKIIRAAIHQTAAELRHTVATCRKFYIHPAILSSYRTHVLHRIMNAAPPRSKRLPKLHADERRVFKIITGPPPKVPATHV